MYEHLWDIQQNSSEYNLRKTKYCSKLPVLPLCYRLPAVFLMFCVSSFQLLKSLSHIRQLQFIDIRTVAGQQNDNRCNGAPRVLYVRIYTSGNLRSFQTDVVYSGSPVGLIQHSVQKQFLSGTSSMDVKWYRCLILSLKSFLVVLVLHLANVRAVSQRMPQTQTQIHNLLTTAHSCSLLSHAN